jgi:hypothetical protein
MRLGLVLTASVTFLGAFCTAGFTGAGTSGTSATSRATSGPAASQPQGLLAPESLLEFVEGRPPKPQEDTATWDRLTSLQREEAMRKYGAGLKAWEAKSNRRGWRVSWVLFLKEVSPIKPGEGFEVLGASETGCLVAAFQPASARDTLLKLEKGTRIEIQGAVKDYGSLSAQGERGLSAYTGGKLVVLLEDATVTPTNKPISTGHPGTSTFFGVRMEAGNVVYAIDRSGSMAVGGVFDAVKREVVKSLSTLKDTHGFHIILFSDTKQPVESPPRRVVAANGTNKREAAKFLEDIIAEGKSNPMPALERAFEVLQTNTMPGKGKVILLLTDGVFTVKNEEVVQFIRSRNKNKGVVINTYLYGHAPEEAATVMKQIAQENGGKYKFVEGD